MLSKAKQGTWSEAARRVLYERYLWKKDGRVVEDPDGMCWRVARAVASAEANWPASGHSVEAVAEEFFNLLADCRFMPNSPTLMNAGKDNGQQLSACFVLPVEDSLDKIFDTLRAAALVHQSGGGTGFAFSRLRPKGAIVRSTQGVASGPVSFMKVFDAATEHVKQGGSRRGANMGILRVDHPDILEFIESKLSGGITNFNISVAATDKFMEALANGTDYDLIAPQTGEVAGSLPAKMVFERMVEAAWRTGDPGMVFIDRANRWTCNPVPELGPLESTNPCGEQFLYGWDACNLGSINLARFAVVKDDKADIDWDELRQSVRSCVRLLDNVIEINPFPIRAITEMVRSNRRIGLGIMGWADLLFELEIPYDSEEALALGTRIMEFVTRTGREMSIDLAKERGPFPNFYRSIYKDGPPIRNSTVTTIAPTGTISIIANCSSGIEPIFALAYRHKSGDRTLEFFNPVFERIGHERRFLTDAVREEVLARGTVHDVAGVPADVQRIFVTSHEIDPDWHVRMQAAFQRHTDNAVSKCIAAGTLIPTSRGLIRIEDFAPTEQEDSFTELDYEIRVDGYRVLSHYRAGVKPATKITLDNGASLTGATESHRVLTTAGWKRLADLAVGDLVIGKFVESHGPGGAALPWESTYRTNANAVRIPAQMTPALAELLGMLVADGHTIESTGQVGLSHKDEQVERAFSRLVQEVFGVSPQVMEDKRTGVRVTYVTSRNLVRFVENLIGKGAYNKVVPDAILQGSAEEKLAFLRGISLDGYVKRGSLCVYEGMSAQCAYHVAEVCRSFGMPKVYQGTKSVPGHGTTHSVVVSDPLQTLIRCVEDHKNVDPIPAAYRVMLPTGAALATRVPITHQAYSALRAIRQEERVYCRSTTAARLGWSAETPVYRVVRVENAGLVDLYDIEVEESHAYVVNGMVSHNTINLPNNASVDDIARAYLSAYDLGCLGITVFRDGCKGEQVLNVGMKEKAVAPAPAAPVIKAEIKPRPAVVHGYTRQIQAPEGKVNITINSDQDGPLEVFINVGRAGSDILALAEAVGRLISLTLRLPSPLSQSERLREVANQLRGIAGSRTVGFGAKQVRSLPDAVAQAVDQHLGEAQGHDANEMSGTNGHGHVGAAQLAMPLWTGNLCPNCGNNTLVFEEGCKKCHACGFTEC